MSGHKLVIKDAARQLAGRIISALFGFITIKIMTPYLGPLRYGDYSTILKYFAIWTALADLGLYVLAVKRLGKIKEENKDPNNTQLKDEYGKFVGTRIFLMAIIYFIAIIVAYLLPAYTSNPYLMWGIPFGMIFSASFMFAGIQQLPLQIFWKMKYLSMSLITARLSQLLILVPVVFLIFKKIEFNGSNLSIVAFCAVLFSVVASGIGQNLEIHFRSKKILPLKIIFDWKFIKNIIGRNRQYGVSYYLSSFHTLIVLLFLGFFFPTSGGFHYAGIWALALSLIEILLIIPSSLGNSLLHKISNYSIRDKRKSLGNLLTIIFRIGGIIAVNFRLFSDQIILIVSGKEYLGTFLSVSSRGSNQILPFLGFVLRQSFIKQVFNYLFVATDKQNVLLGINAIGVAIGVIIGIYTIPKYGLLGGIITQLILEFLFMSGAIIVSIRKKISPIISRKRLLSLLSFIVIFSILGYFTKNYFKINIVNFFIIASILNGLLVYFSLGNIKKVARGLTFE
ncbi:oligosaccharide flippase family protein [Candidatus Gracilibacteria bacterium]|nr:oligosaccharide flippase family protein [Candidatus Gracilibacteria bacterium]